MSAKERLQTLLQLPTTPRTCVCLYRQRGTWRGKNYAFFGFEVKLKLVQDVWLETAGTSYTNLFSLSESHKSALVLARLCASHEHTCTKVSLGLRLIMHASVYPAPSLYCHWALWSFCVGVLCTTAPASHLSSAGYNLCTTSFARKLHEDLPWGLN